jgi:hypothetical protein
VRRPSRSPLKTCCRTRIQLEYPTGATEGRGFNPTPFTSAGSWSGAALYQGMASAMPKDVANK